MEIGIIQKSCDHEAFGLTNILTFLLVRDIMEKAIVLIHGLTDSPYFMTAIADHFFHKLGYNVYMPLLHYHSLTDPMDMEGIDLKEWKINVRFAINTAANKAKYVSIGGLSTGGTLSFYMACINQKINGELYFRTQ